MRQPGENDEEEANTRSTGNNDAPSRGKQLHRHTGEQAAQ